MDKNGKKHFVFCENCFAKLIDQYTEEARGNKYKALYRMCMYTGYYYDDKLAHRVIEEEHKYDDNTPVPKSYHWGLLYNFYIIDSIIRVMMSMSHNYTIGFSSQHHCKS